MVGEKTFSEWLSAIEAYHGHKAPGVAWGGLMIEAIRPRLKSGIFYDVYCETRTCLPDSVQLLTPCTIGNGWLKILDYGRFALCFYDKASGAGWRAGVDLEALAAWPELNAWFLKLKTKAQQDTSRIFSEMEGAGVDVFRVREVQVESRFLKKTSSGPSAVCPRCGESYPASHGPVCRGCSAGMPYAPVGNRTDGALPLDLSVEQ